MAEMSLFNCLRCYGVSAIFFAATLLSMNASVSQTVEAVQQVIGGGSGTTTTVADTVEQTPPPVTIDQLVSTEVRSPNMTLTQAIAVAVATPSAPGLSVTPLTRERLKLTCPAQVGVAYVLEVCDDLGNWVQKGAAYPSTSAVKFQVDLLNERVVSYYRIKAVTPSESLASATQTVIDKTPDQPIVTGIVGGAQGGQ